MSHRVASLILCLAALTAPRAAEAGTSRRLHISTMHVEDLTADGSMLWVATRGGLEAYDLVSGARMAHFTSEHGLVDNHLHKVRIHHGRLQVRSARHTCELSGGFFACSARRPLSVPEPAVAPSFQGARQTAALEIGGTRFVGTAGRGLWRAGDVPERLTPSGQLCSSFATSMAEFAGQLWIGSFAGGLCSSADGGLSFEASEVPFRMVNDLEVTTHGMYIAASEGLYHTLDGLHFDRVEWIDQRGVNGLAFDGRSLWVTTPGALWRLRVRGGPRSRAWWTPAGSRSLQDVEAADGAVWLATEDRGLVRFAKGRVIEPRIFDRAAGMPSSWSLDVALAEDGTAYAATLRDGVVSIRPDETIEPLGDTADDWMLFVEPRGEELWTGSQGGVVVHRDGGVESIDRLPHPNVHLVFHTASSTFVGTENGLLEIANE